MRKLATIRAISKVMPIKGKDRVELAVVDGWTCMVSKADGFKEGSLCVFCEPDSVFPPKEQWEFLKKYNYRIKTQKFKDSDGNAIYSQGLVLPLTIPQMKVQSNLMVGRDVTDLLEITQYEPTMDIDTSSLPKKKYPEWLMRYAWFRKLVLPKKASCAWPSFICKTDEERIQNCPDIVNLETKWIATEKVDGQSGSFAVVRHKHFLWNTYEFIVCSRNMRKPHPDNTSYWQVAKKYNLKEALIGYLKSHKDLEWVALQGECVAPNVQGNKYKVKEADLYVFNLIDSKYGRYNSLTAKTILESMKIKFVPIVDYDIDLHDLTVEQLLQYATGKSKLVDGLREGIVFRSTDGRHSFKAVSPEFLIKHNE